MDPWNKLDFRISDETRKRCQIFQLDESSSRRFRSINPELFHFLYEARAPHVAFKVFLRVDQTMIEFMTKEEFSKELLDQLWGSMQRTRRRLEICVLASEYGAFEKLVTEIREGKIQRLIDMDPSLDRRTLDVYSRLSEVSQMIVKGGINAEVANRVKDGASFMVSNLMDSQAAISTLSRMVTHDATLYDHSVTVAMIASTIGRHCLVKPLTVREAEVVAQCGLYHDVGKTCVPSAVLNKPGKFTAEEFEVMKTHAALGEAELEKIVQDGAPIDPLAVRVAGEHHEKFTGKGYPQGRCGCAEHDPVKGIHQFTRIVTIADVYSALLMKRVYKPAFLPQDAIKIMAETAHDDYDPDIFKPFLHTVVKSLNRQARANDDKSRILVVGDDGQLRELTPPRKAAG